MDPLYRIPGWAFERPLSHAEIGELRQTPLQPDVSARDGRVETNAPGLPVDTDPGGNFTEETPRG